VLLELRDQDGCAGYGEAASWPGFGTETSPQAGQLLGAASELLRGVELEAGQWTPELATLLQDAPAARAAVQGALWDLASRRAGRPLAGHLATCLGPFRDVVAPRVAVSTLLVAQDPDALRDEAARARGAGHRAAKLKLGALPLAGDVARLRAVREGLGDEVRLRGDANGAWNLYQARTALEAFAEFRLDYVEQPLVAGDIGGLAQLRRTSPVRIAADESVATEQGALRLLASGAADVVVLKPATLGGPACALEIAVQAWRNGIEVVFTHTFESAIGAAHALHCAAAWGDPAAIHGLVTAGLFVSDVASPAACQDGYMPVTAAAGIGTGL